MDTLLSGKKHQNGASCLRIVLLMIQQVSPANTGLIVMVFQPRRPEVRHSRIGNCAFIQSLEYCLGVQSYTLFYGSVQIRLELLVRGARHS